MVLKYTGLLLAMSQYLEAVVMSQYLEAVRVWMGKNRLQLNPVKLSGYELWALHRIHSVSIFGSDV